MNMKAVLGLVVISVFSFFFLTESVMAGCPRGYQFRRGRCERPHRGRPVPPVERPGSKKGPDVEAKKEALKKEIAELKGRRGRLQTERSRIEKSAQEREQTALEEYNRAMDPKTGLSVTTQVDLNGPLGKIKVDLNKVAGQMGGAGAAENVRGVSRGIQSVNLGGISGLRADMERLARNLNKSADEIMAQVEWDKKEVARLDREYDKKDKEMAMHRANMEEHKRKAEAFDRECARAWWTCVWNLPKAAWERSMALLDLGKEQVAWAQRNSFSAQALPHTVRVAAAVLQTAPYRLGAELVKDYIPSLENIGNTLANRVEQLAEQAANALRQSQSLISEETNRQLNANSGEMNRVGREIAERERELRNLDEPPRGGARGTRLDQTDVVSRPVSADQRAYAPALSNAQLEQQIRAARETQKESIRQAAVEEKKQDTAEASPPAVKVDAKAEAKNREAAAKAEQALKKQQALLKEAERKAVQAEREMKKSQEQRTVSRKSGHDLSEAEGAKKILDKAIREAREAKENGRLKQLELAMRNLQKDEKRLREGGDKIEAPDLRRKIAERKSEKKQPLESKPEIKPNDPAQKGTASMDEKKRKATEEIEKVTKEMEKDKAKKEEKEKRLAEERARKRQQLLEEERQRERERSELARRQREATQQAPSQGGGYCNPDIPRYSQPGCIEPPSQEAPPSTQGRPCNPNVPRYSQPGCVE